MLDAFDVTSLFIDKSAFHETASDEMFRNCCTELQILDAISTFRVLFSVLPYDSSPMKASLLSTARRKTKKI